MAEALELEALKALANCGLMSSRQLSNWVYPPGNGHTTKAKAQRLLARLEESGDILRRQVCAPVPDVISSNKLIVWALTRGGADRANDNLEATGYRRWAHHGTDLGLMLSGRHNATVDFLTKRRAEGWATVGRAGIRAGVVSSGEFGECDGVIAKQDGECFYTKGVIAVDDSQESTQARVKRALKQTTAVILIGEPRIVAKLQKLLGQ